MTQSKNVFLDNEFTIMSEIVENKNVTQRELSRKLGVSVSTVNVIIKKMITEGQIKMNQVSQKQVFYMLTPVGMMEKAKKTIRYLKVHYRAIYETKEKIKSVLEELKQDHDAIFVLICDDEMGEMMSIAVDEFKSNHSKLKIVIIDKIKKVDKNNFELPVLLHMALNEDLLKEYEDIKELKIVNLAERL